jgi:hypothetical protein
MEAICSLPCLTYLIPDADRPGLQKVCSVSGSGPMLQSSVIIRSRPHTTLAWMHAWMERMEGTDRTIE